MNGRAVRHTTLALIVLFIVALIAWVRFKPPTYETTATIAFVTTTTGNSSGELYDHFTNNHIYTALSVGRLFTNPSTAERLRREGGTAEFRFSLAHYGNEEVPNYDQPYASLSSVSASAKQSRRTMDLALKLLSDQLSAWQRGVGANGQALISWQLIDQIRGPAAQSLQLSRATVGILIIGLLALAWTARTLRDRDTS